MRADRSTGSRFTDMGNYSWAAASVDFLYENGITTGVGNGKFNPTGTCTRAQIAAFLARLYAEKGDQNLL